MEKGFLRVGLSLASLTVFFLGPSPARAQLVLGQYEDEAPLRSWNVFGTSSAAALGLGGARFAVEETGQAASTNPALLALLPEYSLTLTVSSTSATLFKYSLVNTGVASTRGNLRATFVGPTAGAVALRKGAWALAFGSSVLEAYLRPSVGYLSPSYSLEWEQTGLLRGFSVSLARRLGRALSVGVGATYAAGRLSRSTVEGWPDEEITITDDKSEKFRGVFLNGGLRAELASWLTAALVFRSPYVKKSDGESLLRYEAPREGTDIRIEAEARNEYEQPWVVGIGTKIRLVDGLVAAADAAYFGWSRYAVLYFDEPLTRSFRDVVQLCGGIEYALPVRVRGRDLAFPLRLGFTLDPQPMVLPRSSYSYISFGTGLRIGRLSVDAASRFGWERGSGDDLTAIEAALTVRYSLGEEE
jgi:hypothetical protein